MAAESSSISKALANDVESISIPNPGVNIHEWTKGAAFSGRAPRTVQHPGLPTPPSSISPNFPDHSLSARALKEGLTPTTRHVESDIDLHDTPERARHLEQDVSMTADDGESLEEHGNITPLLLARQNLPDILLSQGPVAIRHIMTHLNTTLPGFADIPPAKARRIVVSALESRHGGGLYGDVHFEKVGWGRWNARVGHRRGSATMHPIQEDGSATANRPSAAQSRSAAVLIPGAKRAAGASRRLSHGSWTAESMSSTRSEHGERRDAFVNEHDADSMEIDEDCANTLYKPQMQKALEDPTFYSDTDEEDWSTIGAAALRANSYSSESKFPRYQTSKRRSRTRSPFPSFSHSLPSHHKHRNRQRHYSDTYAFSDRQRLHEPALDFTGVNVDSQEREAIEALMKMGSM